MRRNPIPWLLLAILLAALWAWQAPRVADAPARPTAAATPAASPATAPSPVQAGDANRGLPAFLPREARDTIRLVQHGGPFPHRQDGSVFGNREGLLPRQPRGWYREYTVDTPGLDHRGTRRIVTGGQPPREWYYSDDHYGSFRRFEVQGATP